MVLDRAPLFSLNPASCLLIALLCLAACLSCDTNCCRLHPNDLPTEEMEISHYEQNMPKSAETERGRPGAGCCLSGNQPRARLRGEFKPVSEDGGAGMDEHVVWKVTLY